MISATRGLFFPSRDPFGLCGVIDWSPENKVQKTSPQSCSFFHPTGLLLRRLFLNRANKTFAGELSSMNGRVDDLSYIITSYLLEVQ